MLPIKELETLLPVLKEKETQGLILPSYAKAVDLVNWVKRGRSLTERQALFVGRLILRAKRKHRNVKIDLTGGAPAIDADEIVAKVLEKIGDQKTDVDAVVAAVIPKINKEHSEQILAAVMTALEERVPRKVEIVVQKEGKTIKTKGSSHCQFERLVRAATSRLPSGYAPGIFLQGEASSGKTTGTRMLAESLRLDWYFNGAITMPHEMLGFVDAGGRYHRTPFRDAYEHGGVYTFDEVDRSDPVALLGVNPHLANGIATFPDKQVKRHKDCIIVCTANTWGLGADANYSGATKLDAAFLSRFPVRINWDIDPELESAIVPNAKWLERVRRARSRARETGLKVMIDTRIAQAGAALIAAGYTEDEAAASTYLANLKPEQRVLVGG